MNNALDERIARALGWTVADVRSFSRPTLREVVRPVDAGLADEITVVMEGWFVVDDRTGSER